MDQVRNTDLSSFRCGCNFCHSCIRTHFRVSRASDKMRRDVKQALANDRSTVNFLGHLHRDFLPFCPGVVGSAPCRVPLHRVDAERLLPEMRGLEEQVRADNEYVPNMGTSSYSLGTRSTHLFALLDPETGETAGRGCISGADRMPSGALPRYRPHAASRVASVASRTATWKEPMHGLLPSLPCRRFCATGQEGGLRGGYSPPYLEEFK